MPGPFHFAWIAAPVAFDPVAHAVEDEAITELQITQSEGDFAGMTMTVLNPGEGLLAPDRQQWCWLSWDTGAGIVPLFTGRLVAVPESVDGEAVKLLFAAKPPSYDQIKADYAESLKVLPYYDRIWIAAGSDDPDAVLNGYGAQWHIARDTLALTHSDELVGEGGTLTIGEADHTYDNFAVSYSQPPLSRVDLDGTIAWKQTGRGTIDLTWDVYSICVVHKSIYRMNTISPYGTPAAPKLKSGVISSLTGDGLKNDWPKPNADFGGGWTVNAATGAFEAPKGFMRYTYEVKYRQLSQEALDALNQLQQSSFATGAPPPPSALMGYGVTGLHFGGYSDYVVQFPISAIEQFTLFDWAADRGRTEVVRCSMAADIQALLADPDSAENIAKISINAQDTVTEPDASGVMAIGDTRRASYLNTDRGNLSVQYLLLLGRAELRRRARAVDISCRMPWARGIAATLRHNAHVVDRRLPSGEAIGKITGYAFAAAGDGAHYVDLTIGCAIGHDTSVTAAAGTPDYVDLGYVAAGFQTMSGAEIMLPTADLVYESLDSFPVNDDGVNLLAFDRQQAVQSLTLSGGMDDQVTVVNATSDPIDALGHYPTRICFQMTPVAGMNFETPFAPTIQPLPIPQQINLEAETVAINPSGIPGWMAFKPQLLIHPSYDVVSRDYQRYRIPRPPEPDTGGSEPGKICWGVVGTMPTAQPAPTVDFNVNTETSRKSEDVRIQNPDDPTQYVIADRAKEITFNTAHKAAPPGPNTASEPAPGMSDYSVEDAAGFKPVGGSTQSGGTSTFKYASTSPP